MWKSTYVGVYQLLNWKMQGWNIEISQTLLYSENTILNLSEPSVNT